jgi:uncharacterized protein (TIGR02172 family)
MGENLVIKLTERIDAKNSEKVLEEINEKINASDCIKIELDAENLTYISSAGLRILLSIKKKSGKALAITNVSSEVYDIFDVTGFNQMLDVKKKKREVSVEGCEIIGKGFCGTVYRLDPETIIKVYKSEDRDSVEMIENEKKMAKLALINGVPTAISYDIVKVGKYYGSVFELLNAKSFNDLVIENPDKVEDIVKEYVNFLKLIHGITIEDKMLPSAKDKFKVYIDSVKEYFDEDLFKKLCSLVDSVKECRNVVHGDPQMKNIMRVDGEPMFIDMDTLCAGSFLFDLQAFYVTYIVFAEDEPENNKAFLGIEQAYAEKIWNLVFKYYFDDKTDAEKENILDRIKVLSYIRFMYIVGTSSLKNTDVGKLRLKHSVEHLKELASKYDSLA